MKKNLFVITEDEKKRILNLHKSATKRNYVFEQATTPVDQNNPNMNPVTGNQGAPVVGAVTPQSSVANIPVQTAPTTPAAGTAPTTGTTAPTTGTTAPTTGTTAPTTGTTPEKSIIMLNDLDYEYKKEGDKYFFKIKPNAKTPKLQKLLKKGKFKDFTEAKPGTESFDAISKLNWAKGDKLDIKLASSMKVSSPLQATSQQVGAAPAAGLSSLTLKDPVGEAKKLMPYIGLLDPVKQKEVATWSTSPAGKYVLAQPVEQRENALDILEKRKGDQTTKTLKKEIRTALGMAADTALQRLGQGIKGAVAGFKKGAQGQQPPTA
jgi:hypothetical protein